jgi:hypothetical protein
MSMRVLLQQPAAKRFHGQLVVQSQK